MWKISNLFLMGKQKLSQFFLSKSNIVFQVFFFGTIFVSLGSNWQNRKVSWPNFPNPEIYLACRNILYIEN